MQLPSFFPAVHLPNDRHNSDCMGRLYGILRTRLAAGKKSDAKPEAHSAGHDGVIDSTDDGRDTLRNSAPR